MKRQRLGAKSTDRLFWTLKNDASLCRGVMKGGMGIYLFRLVQEVAHVVRNGRGSNEGTLAEQPTFSWVGGGLGGLSDGVFAGESFCEGGLVHLAADSGILW